MRAYLSALTILSTAAVASATNLYTDAFNYPAGSGLGTNAPWENVIARTPPMTVQAGSLNYPGLPTAGNSLQLNNAIGDTNVVSLGASPLTSGTVYYSMVLQLNAAFTGSGQPYFAGFDDNASGGTFDTGASLVARRNAGDNSKIDLGIAAAAASPGNNNTKIYSPTPYSTTDMLFVVGSYTFNPNAKDDVARLYVFANGEAIPTSEPGTPAAMSTTAPGNADYAGIYRFYLRDNTGEPPTILADELRIGTSWQDILPLAGDTNLNGRIGADDYALIDRGYARYQSGAIPPNTAGWTDGDFNADHAVDAGDYLLIDQALVAQGGTLSPELLAERQAAFGDAYVAALAGAVPEPASLGLVTAGAIGLLAGRRRRQGIA
jgi:hypothetical protein